MKGRINALYQGQIKPTRFCRDFRQACGRSKAPALLAMLVKLIDKGSSARALSASSYLHSCAMCRCSPNLVVVFCSSAHRRASLALSLALSLSLPLALFLSSVFASADERRDALTAAIQGQQKMTATSPISQAQGSARRLSEAAARGQQGDAGVTPSKTRAEYAANRAPISAPVGATDPFGAPPPTPTASPTKARAVIPQASQAEWGGSAAAEEPRRAAPQDAAAGLPSAPPAAAAAPPTAPPSAAPAAPPTGGLMTGPPGASMFG